MRDAVKNPEKYPEAPSDNKPEEDKKRDDWLKKLEDRQDNDNRSF